MVSFQDDLITVYINKLLRWIAVSLLRSPGALWARGFGRILFRKAQRAAERLHARMRHDLLKMDEQLGDALAFSGRPE
jgi:preprotein translocase subunit SecA